jgi:D-alanyl-D-alanine carboxypeptidase (penicillin-binding protein 5/6)
MRIALDAKPLAEVPVVAIEGVELGSVFARGWDAIRLFFQ